MYISAACSLYTPHSMISSLLQTPLLYINRADYIRLNDMIQWRYFMVWLSHQLISSKLLHNNIPLIPDTGWKSCRERFKPYRRTFCLCSNLVTFAYIYIGIFRNLTEKLLNLYVYNICIQCVDTYSIVLFLSHWEIVTAARKQTLHLLLLLL